MMQESSDSEHSNHDERDQDAFASLQSLFEKHTQQEKEKKVGALNREESVANDDAKEEETTLQENETKEETTMQENESSSMGHQERNHEVPVQDNNDNVIPESQSQFPLAEDWEPSQEEANLTQQTTRPAIPMVSQHYTAAEHTNVSSINTPSISSGLIKELHRAQQKKNAASKPLAAAMNPPRVVDSNLLSELEKNRKREALEKKTTRPRKQIAGGSSINKSLRPQFHRNRPQKTQVAEDTKSIVGSRPQHWGAAKTAKHASSAKTPRKLAASPKSSHPASVVPPKSRSRLSLTQPSKKSLVKQIGRRSFDEQISFAPHFFHTKKSNPSVAQQEDDIESSQRPSAPAYQTPRILQRFNQNVNNAAYSAGSSNGSDPKRKRKQQSGKKLKAGPLMKRLRSLRSAVNGDTIRFQSGMYPFAQSANKRFDLSDPRNRAASYVDVSIVGEPVPWDEHDRITALGFIHKSAKVTTKGSTSDFAGRLIGGSRFAWISFTYETAREQNVRKGSKLRIYNTVSIPSSSTIQVRGFSVENDATIEQRCEHTILCTQLCETYPDSLPALPDVVAINKS
jgi:hypothetical protein